MKMFQRRIYGGIFAAALGILCAVQAGMPAFAKGQEGSLKVTYATEDGALDNVNMFLYYIGSLGKDKGIAWDEDFEEYRLYGQVNDGLAGLLQGYVQRDGVEADETAVTDGTGASTFGSLKDGYYLVIGDTAIQDGATLHMLPVLAYVGGDTKEVSAEAKFECADVGQGPVSISTTKEWELAKDKEKGEAVVSGDKMPKSVQADLMQDGELMETVKLSEENGWTYRWEELPSGHVYQVLETAVGKGFELSAEHKDGVFTLTNHGVYNKAVSKNPPKDDKDKDKEKEKKDVTPGNGTPAGSGNGNAPNGAGGKLPQTGMLFWPIAACAAGCGAAGGAGWYFIRKGRKRG